MRDFKEISVVITKTAGLILIVYAIAFFPTSYSSYVVDDQTSFGLKAASFFGSLMPPLILGLIMFFLPGSVANRAVSGEVGHTLPLSSLSILLCAAIGLFFVARSLGDLVYWGSYYNFLEAAGLETSSHLKASLLATFAELTLGILLVVGRSRIGKLMYSQPK